MVLSPDVASNFDETLKNISTPQIWVTTVNQ